MPTTTIQIQEDTLEFLKMIKEQSQAKTYDEVIHNFMVLGDYAKQFRGFLGKKDRKMLLKGLRDEGD